MSRKLVLLGVGLVTLALAAPAFAVTDRWAAWSPVDGASNAFRLTMTQQARGFPAATVATDSRSPVQVPTGATAFLGPGTPPGAKYGSSASNPYLVLRARADSPTAPSTTTYSFDAPTPDTGWAFVLGDIDADQVAITATDATGTPVPATEVDTWFRGTFNYTGGADQPTWNATTSTLTGNAGAVDTDGAAGWFEPDVRLSSLTMTFTRRAGFPVYQTWFVSRARLRRRQPQVLDPPGRRQPLRPGRQGLRQARVARQDVGVRLGPDLLRGERQGLDDGRGRDRRYHGRQLRHRQDGCLRGLQHPDHRAAEGERGRPAAVATAPPR
jgi:hypothetical protein